MNADTQTLYQKAIKFATLKHVEKGQTIPGTELPYVVHLSNVAMEILVASRHSSGFDVDFALQLALLHDTLEDTDTTVDELTDTFGIDITSGVSALTKNDKLPKEEKMLDSLSRIKKLRTEVWAVKLADRITNLQAPPPPLESPEKLAYQQEAKIILETLKGGNQYLENRLRGKIIDYGTYIDT